MTEALCAEKKMTEALVIWAQLPRPLQPLMFLLIDLIVWNDFWLVFDFEFDMGIWALPFAQGFCADPGPLLKRFAAVFIALRSLERASAPSDSVAHLREKGYRRHFLGRR